MGSTFASADIAAIVLAFPPPLPSRDYPSLVRSHSGGRLLRSGHVLSSFKSLLETHSQRLPTSRLPSLLEIRECNWLFECYDEPIYYSRDRASIIPKPVYDQIAIDLQASAHQRFLVRDELSRLYDVSTGTVQALVTGLREVTVEERGRTAVYVATEALIAQIQERIQSAIDGANDEKISLVTAGRGLSQDLMLALAKDVVRGGEGEVLLVDESATFVPAAYTAKRATEHQTRVQEYLHSLRERGFFTADHESEAAARDACQQWHLQHSANVDITVESCDSGKKAYLLTADLQAVLGSMRSAAQTYLREHEDLNNGTISGDLLRYMIDHSSSPEMVEAILETRHRQQLEDLIGEMIEQKSRDVFESRFRTIMLTTALLYSAGLDSIRDQALKQRLDEYILQQFKLGELHQFSATLKKRKLHELPIARDLDKWMDDDAGTATTITKFSNSLQKFAKKQKISAPAGEDVDVQRRKLLQVRLDNVLHPQARHSDILQNLIWILLASAREGLFLSPGKDTGRMIKQYQALGDADVAGHLDRWRELLKKGEESDADVEGMRQLARETIERLR